MAHSAVRRLELRGRSLLASRCRSDSLPVAAAEKLVLLVHLPQPADRASGRIDQRCYGRGDDGGVLARGGQTEASVDLAKLANLTPAAMICEVMNDDGTMARLPDLENFANRHGLKIISVKALQEYRSSTEVAPISLRAAS